ncbi:MAG: nucleotide exchange factor GrpE [Bifidobacterium sp.]|jgi:molecular chaperone GrpE|nr:nucleotide exchange factor GrpE [Bifidobacterium sp.]MCI1864874.1 nucleotide exchange factor GrpE [Bifidobacterium sp.]
MSEFNKDDYLDDLPDAQSLNDGSAPAGPQGGHGDDATKTPPSDGAAASRPKPGEAGRTDHVGGDGKPADGDSHDGRGRSGAETKTEQGGPSDEDRPASDQPADKGGPGSQDGLTALGKAKKEAADYLEALQRERAEFVNYRNRSAKEQERFRQHGIIDVLTALLPALDDIDRVREHSEMDDSFKAVSAKIDKAFEKFGVEKFGEKGEDFDPTKHEAILHRPDAQATKETVDTVVEAGYRIGDRVIRAARVVVAAPQQ